MAGSQVVGLGDEIVTTQNDRRLITTAGVEALIRSIDLRTIDLSAHLPRTGIERTTSEALGLSQRRDGADIALPLLPGHGLDAGPDLGL